MLGFAALMKQRRRWLNGTFFAMIYTLSNWGRIWSESHHSLVRKLVGGGLGVGWGGVGWGGVGWGGVAGGFYVEVVREWRDK